LTVSYRSRYLDRIKQVFATALPISLTSDLRKGFPMKIKIIVNLLAITIMLLASVAVAQEQTTSTNAAVPADTRIPRNSKVYIAPMDGFEIYLAAAMRKKEVPIVMVTEPEFADFQIMGNHDKKNAGWAKTIFLGDARSTASASIQVVNMRTKVVVFADSSHRSSANRGERSTAEKLAKYLKKKIEDDEKLK
jgi:hypothetical protein